MNDPNVSVPVPSRGDPSMSPAVVVVHDAVPNTPRNGHARAIDVDRARLEDAAKASSGTPTPVVDRRQEEVMAVISPDGRPPQRRLRLAGWKWLLIGIAAIGLVGVVWTVSRGVDGTTLLVGGAMVLALLAAAVPVWGSGLLRGAEEREARKVAVRGTPRDRSM